MPGVFISDSFNAADGSALTSRVPEKGGAWTTHPVESATLVISSGATYGTAGTGYVINAAQSASSDMSVEADFVWKSAISGGFGVSLRLNPAAATGYFFGVSDGINWAIWKQVALSWTLLGQVAMGSVSPGTILAIRAEVEGNAQRLYLNGALLVTAGDSAIPAGTQMGIQSSAAATASTGAHITRLVGQSLPILPLVPVRVSRKIGSFSTRTRLFRADRHGNILEEVPVLNPTGGAIGANEDTSPHRTLSLDVAYPGLLRPFRDYVVPEVTLVYPDGSKDSASQGVYLVTGKKERGNAGQVSETIQGHDTTWHLLNAQVGAVSFPIGTDPGPACRALAVQAGFAPGMVDIPDTGSLLTVEKNPNPGASIHSVMVELLNAVNWYAPWLTWDFRLRSRPWMNTAAAPTDVEFGHETDRPILREITADPDYSRLKNAVTVRRIQQNEPPIWATARIENQAHPLYFDPLDPNVGLGYEMAAPPVDVQDLPDAAAALAQAKSLLADNASYYRPARVQAVMDLRADLHQIVELHFRTKRLADLYAGRWIRRAWTLQLSGTTAATDMDVYRVEDIF